jgi:hypothetical protein
MRLAHGSLRIVNRAEHELSAVPVTPFRISNGALASTDLPTRLKILNWGANESTKGKVVLDDRSVSAFAANQRALGYDRVAIDYEHATVPGSPAYAETAEPRQVAGYATPRIVPGDGLYLESIEWTPSGRANAKNYADLSPAPKLDKDGRILFLHSTALCRNGAVYDLSFFSAAKPSNPQPNPMPTETEAILTRLETLNTTLSAIEGRLKAVEDRKQVGHITTLGVAAADGKVTTLNVGDLVDRLAGIETKLTAAQTAAENAEKAQVIARFSAEGKAPLGEDGKPLSAESLQTFSAGELRRLLANTQPTVPLSARGRQPAGEKRDDTLKGLARANAALAQRMPELN